MNNKILSNLFFLTCASIIAVPLVTLVPFGIDLWYVQYLALFSVFCIGISIYLARINIPMGIFLTYCLGNTIFVAKQDPRTMFCLIQIILACLAIDLISRFTKRQANIILTIILGLTIFQGAFVIVQYFNLDPFFTPVNDEWFSRTVGISCSRNQIGLFFAIVSPLVLANAIWITPLVVFGLFCSSTTSAWAGFLAGCICLCSFKLRRELWKVLILLCICSAIFFVKFEHISAPAYKQRIDLYKHTIESVESESVVMKRTQNGNTFAKEVTCNKWLGYGLGKFTQISVWTQERFLHKGQSHVYSHAHNDLLEIWYELGRVGLLLALFMIGKLFRDFIYARKTKILVICFSCILAQLVSSLGIFTVQTAISGMLLVIFFGLFTGEIRRQNG